MWIELTESDLADYLAGEELVAMQTAALGDGQDNPVPEILAQIVREVRGYVAAWQGNTLGAGQTVPDELKTTALVLARWRVINRLPGMSFLASDERKHEYDEANRLLREVAAGRFRIVSPETATEENLSGPQVTVVSSRPPSRRMTGESLRGL